ncbi:MAG TPA: hypothetical protein VEA59_03870 [Patescibacteria group bacterium]|nr:hypothetical protein [Patescibacteria group bacterium]
MKKNNRVYEQMVAEAEGVGKIAINQNFDYQKLPDTMAAERPDITSHGAKRTRTSPAWVKVLKVQEKRFVHPYALVRYVIRHKQAALTKGSLFTAWTNDGETWWFLAVYLADEQIRFELNEHSPTSTWPNTYRALAQPIEEQ